MLRRLRLTSLILLALVAAIYLAIRFLLFPTLDWWRPQAEKLLTNAIGQQTIITGLHGHLDGFNPIIGVESIRIGDDAQRPALIAKSLNAAFSAGNLLSGMFTPDELTLAGANIQIERIDQATFDVGGVELTVPPSQSSAAEKDPAARAPWQLPAWILEDHNLDLNNVEVHYRDRETGASLTAYDLSLQSNQIDGQRSLTLNAPRFSNQPGTIRLETTLSRGKLERLTPLSGWQGQAQLSIEGFDIVQLSALSRGAQTATSGSVDVQATFDLIDGSPSSATLQLAANNISIPTDDAPAELSAVNASVAAAWRPNKEVRLVLQEASLVGKHGNEIGFGNAEQFVVLNEQYQLIEGQLGLKGFDLRNLSEFAKGLPLKASQRERIAHVALSGTVDDLALKFDARPDPVEYQLDASFTKLSASIDKRLKQNPPQTWSPHAPGVANISGKIQANNHGGTAKLRSADATKNQSATNSKKNDDLQKTAISLAGIFAEPRIELDHLAADLSWIIDKSNSGFSVEIRQFNMANGDAEAAVTGTYIKSPGRKGVANLGGWLKRAKASRLPRYLPLKLPSKVRGWLSTAKPLGFSNDIKWVLSGDLDKFPFRSPDKGEFTIRATVSRASLTYAPNWPRATRAKVKLLFQGAGMEIDVVDGLLFDGVSIDNARVSINDYRDAIVSVTGSTTASARQATRFGLATPIARNVSQNLKDTSLEGRTKAVISLKIPLKQIAAIEYQGKGQLTDVRVNSNGDFPAISKINGEIDFSNDGIQVDALKGEILATPFQLKIRSAPKQATEIEVNGQVSADAIRRLTDHPLSAALEGKASYRAKVGLNRNELSVSVTSQLTGMSFDLPEPFQKSAAAKMPLALELTPLRPKDYSASTTNESDQLSIKVGDLARAIFRRKVNSQGVMRVERGVVAIGSKATLPASGFRVEANTQSINVDQWLKLMRTEKINQSNQSDAKAGKESNGGFFDGFDFTPISTKVVINDTRFVQRKFSNVVIDASRQAQRWTVKIDSDQVKGDASFVLGNTDTPGEFLAKFSRFELPNPAETGSKASVAAKSSVIAPAWLPEIRLQVDQFILGEIPLGKLTLASKNQSGSWQIDELKLVHPAATFSATGAWRNTNLPGIGKTKLDLSLDVSDSGAYLNDLGLPGVIRNAPGKIVGQLSWNGTPAAPDISSLGGSLKIAFREGQFLKADPGLAKLISVLSLQSISRRLRFDFSDLFDEGLAFNAIVGIARIERGVITAEPLILQGVQAEVIMSGSADLQHETQDLNVKIEPHINVGLASLAYAAFINPAVGLAGLLAQWALKKPLKSVFGFEYQITGPWAKPNVVKMSGPAPESNHHSGY